VKEKPRQTKASVRFGRGWLAAALIVICGFALADLGCRRSETTGPAVVDSGTDFLGDIPPDDLNIVLITIDTLRSDRVSSYGSVRVDTPNIDAFADEGVKFTNAASTVPFTFPAHSWRRS